MSSISNENETVLAAATRAKTTPNQEAAINEANPSSKMQIVTYMDSSLYNAAANGKIDTLRSHKEELGHLVARNGNSVLHTYIKGASPNAPMVEDILEMCRTDTLLVQTNMKEETPLHIAARYGHPDIVKVLIARAKGQHEDIESGRLMIRMTNKEKDTALHEAVRNDHHSVAKILIKEDPDFLYSANNAEETPLYLAAERGNSGIVSEILETCKSPAHTGPNGKTALHASVIRNDQEITKIILKKKESLTNDVDQQGWTPLHYAAYFGCTRIAYMLLERDKSAAICADKEEGRTPIHIAARRGFHETMNKIMEISLDCCELVDKKSQNILHLAVQSNNEKTVNVILNNQHLNYLLNQKDDEGNTPLHLCAASAFYMPSLIKHPGVDKMAFNQKNLTALDIIETNDKFCAMKREFISDLKKAGYKRGFRNSINNFVSENEISIKEQIISDLNEAKEYHLVVAALIATVTFTAGFTLPGGFISNDSPNAGSAILTKNSSFQAFVIFDTISMLCSTSAVLFHFYLPLQKDKTRLFWYFANAFFLTLVAIVTMILAFVTGTYAVLEDSVGLAVSTCIIGLLFCISFFVLLWKRKSKRLKKSTM